VTTDLDGAGRVSTVKDSLTGGTSYGYDAVGNPHEPTDSMERDDLGV